MFDWILMKLFPEPAGTYPNDNLVGILEDILHENRINKKREVQFFHNMEAGYTIAYKPLNKKEVAELTRTLRLLNMDGMLNPSIFGPNCWITRGNPEFSLKTGMAYLNPSDKQYSKKIARSVSIGDICTKTYTICKITITDEETILVRLVSDIKQKVRGYTKHYVELELRVGRRQPWLINSRLQ